MKNLVVLFICLLFVISTAPAFSESSQSLLIDTFYVKDMDYSELGYSRGEDAFRPADLYGVRFTAADNVDNLVVESETEYFLELNPSYKRPEKSMRLIRLSAEDAMIPIEDLGNQYVLSYTNDSSGKWDWHDVFDFFGTSNKNGLLDVIDRNKVFYDRSSFTFEVEHIDKGESFLFVISAAVTSDGYLDAIASALTKEESQLKFSFHSDEYEIDEIVRVDSSMPQKYAMQLPPESIEARDGGYYASYIGYDKLTSVPSDIVLWKYIINPTIGDMDIPESFPVKIKNSNIPGETAVVVTWYDTAGKVDRIETIRYDTIQNLFPLNTAAKVMIEIFAAEHK